MLSPCLRVAATAACGVLITASLPALAQPTKSSPPSATTAPNNPALLPDQEIGRRFTIKAEDLPPPKTGPVVSSRSLTLPHAGQTLRVPEGFTATPFATGLEHPRRLLVLPNGDVILAEQRVGHLTLLREGASGRAEWIERHAEGFRAPYGLAWRDGFVLVADQDGIWRVPQVVINVRAGRDVQKKVDEIPPVDRQPEAGSHGADMIPANGQVE